MGSFGRAYWSVRGGSLGRAYVSSSGSAWVNSRALSGRLVISGSRKFTQARLGNVGFNRVGSGHSCATKGRRVHSGLLGFTQARQGVVGFIRIRVVSLGGA